MASSICARAFASAPGVSSGAGAIFRAGSACSRSHCASVKASLATRRPSRGKKAPQRKKPFGRVELIRYMLIGYPLTLPARG